MLSDTQPVSGKTKHLDCFATAGCSPLSQYRIIFKSCSCKSLGHKQEKIGSRLKNTSVPLLTQSLPSYLECEAKCYLLKKQGVFLSTSILYSTLPQVSPLLLFV
ncbi:hypothetical protein ABVT39_015054 [Epinephelus coioides]